MATQYYDNEPSIVDKHFDEAFHEAQEARFSGNDFIGFLPSIGKNFIFELLHKWNGQNKTFQPTKSKILDGWNCKKPLRSGFHSLANRYFNKIKARPNSGQGQKTERPDLLDTIPEPVTTSVKATEAFGTVDWERVEETTEWSVWLCERTREIHLTHFPTASHSESLYTLKNFDCGSISVGGRPCLDKTINEFCRKIHTQKGIEIVYRILSGRL